MVVVFIYFMLTLIIIPSRPMAQWSSVRLGIQVVPELASILPPKKGGGSSRVITSCTPHLLHASLSLEGLTSPRDKG